MKIIKSQKYKDIFPPEWSNSTFYTTLEKTNPTTGQLERLPVEYVVRWNSVYDGSHGDLGVSVVSVKNEKTQEELPDDVKAYFNNFLVQEATNSLRDMSPKPGDPPEGW